MGVDGSRMTQFMGSHTSRLDAKGRVSIPAPFRALLRSDAANADASTLVLRPSHKHGCIEGWPAAAFDELATPLTRLDVFSEELDDLAATLFPDAHPMQPDKEGRIVLPDELIAHAGLGTTVTFLGMGRIFHVWEPAAGERFRAEARERARAGRMTVKGAPN